MGKQAASLANYSFGERAIHEHTMASRVTQKMQSTYHGTRGGKSPPDRSIRRIHGSERHKHGPLRDASHITATHPALTRSINIIVISTIMATSLWGLFLSSADWSWLSKTDRYSTLTQLLSFSWIYPRTKLSNDDYDATVHTRRNTTYSVNNCGLRSAVGLELFVHLLQFLSSCRNASSCCFAESSLGPERTSSKSRLWLD